MIKFTTGLFIGLSIISVLAETKSTDTYILSQSTNTVKLLVHLDSEELLAIKEACK